MIEPRPHSATESPPTHPGLSAAEAAIRLKRHGHNELPLRGRPTILNNAARVIREPMFVLLLAAGLIYLLLGDLRDALLLLGFVLVSMTITIVQERKTERVLESLKRLTSPRALVMRDGKPARIPGREVVKGDLMVLEEGDRVAADGALLESHDLLIDESLLTGESNAVAKETPGAGQGDDAEAQQVYSGSMIVRGGGLALVTATGIHTALGRIGKSLQALTPEQSPLQQELRLLITRFALFGAALSVLVVLLYAATRGDWLNGLLAGITLAMSILPEEFTVILTVFMTLGAWRIARNQVLARHAPVIEALGSATVLCVDKTGTLTRNRMSVKTVVIDHEFFDLSERRAEPLPAALRELLQRAVLACEIHPFDPMEKAFHDCLSSRFPEDSERLRNWTMVHEYPLTKDFLAMTHAWRAPGERAIVIATKGAPEAIAEACGLEPKRRADVMAQVEQLGESGMRVLAIAQAHHHGEAWPERPDDFEFTWLGLVGLADPIRPEVAAAVAECREAGIRVAMITGDYPVTAQAIAREAGLPADRIVTGAQIQVADDATLRALAREAHVFARILPEQKLRLVEAFKADGEIVAMTGDGVNDAPALKAAHIGISMGERGTDVAREASSLVLLNDDFASIVHAIRLGRRIYDNLRKALTYVVAVHLPIAGMVMFPLLFGMPIAFAPIHIVFLEMIINPACAIIFEAEEAEADIMSRPPRRLSERLFGTRNVMLAVLQGFGLFAAVAAVFVLALDAGLEHGQARALAFACVVIGNLALIVSSRSPRIGLLSLLRTPNQAQWWIVAGAGVALAASLNAPVLQRAFHFSAVQPAYVMATVLACGVAIVWFEMVKLGFMGWTRTRGG